MMNFDSHMSSADCDDASLVGACLKGDRDAFAQIVARYQSLVASIAYSATGSIAQSEDLAQETFLVAWRRLKALREPGKLRAWLCGIARHSVAKARRRQRREPAHEAESIEQITETAADEALPTDEAISREEEAILWRSLEQIPETYREPLILFYRDDQSIERVAEELELSSEAVRQRLSRGRKLLENQVASFVEGALRKSIPGRSFTAGVISALPAQLAGAGFASLSATTAKGAAAKFAGFLPVFASMAGFVPGLVSACQGYRNDMSQAHSAAARRAVRKFYVVLAACVLMPVALIWVAVLLRPIALSHPTLFSGLVIAIALSWIPGAIVLFTVMKQKMSPAANGSTNIPLLEWRTKAAFLGLPLMHLRLGGSSAAGCNPVKAWIAVGDVAFGGLLALGGIAVAPICCGGLAVGAVVFGGFAAGILTYAGYGIGIWAIGGFILGLYSVGGCAIGWSASLGGVAIARQLAVGGVAIALHANDAVANTWIRSQTFFGIAYLLVTKWLWPTMLLATLPTLFLSHLQRRARRAVQN